jgi:hypothetical protein
VKVNSLQQREPNSLDDLSTQGVKHANASSGSNVRPALLVVPLAKEQVPTKKLKAVRSASSSDDEQESRKKKKESPNELVSALRDSSHFPDMLPTVALGAAPSRALGVDALVCVAPHPAAAAVLPPFSPVMTPGERPATTASQLLIFN